MTTKTCTKCGTEHPASREFFGRCAAARDGLAWYCKDCSRANRRRYYAEHVETERTRSLARYRANRALYAEQAAKRRMDNMEAYKARDSAYVASHYAEKLANNRKRYALRKGSSGSHTAADITDQYLRQHGRCYWCGEHVGKKYHVDHVIPLARGGSNDPSNLVISCPMCNLRKHTKLPHEFAERLC